MNILKEMPKLTALLLAAFIALLIPFAVSATEDTHTVTYVADGEVVATQEVAHGGDTAAPQIPGKFGYTQIAPQWNHNGKNITEDTTITAQYTLNEYVVTYKVGDETYKRLTYLHGEQVLMVPVPEKAGYTAAWDTIIDVLTDDITVNAVYTEISVTQTQPDDLSQPTEWDNGENEKWMPIIVGATVVIIGLLVLLLIQKKKNDKERQF